MNEKLEKLHRARSILSQENLLCFTMDIDWASDYAIASAISLFREAGIPVTAFLTHKSAEIDRALAAGEIKCGIHPNFMPDSSQGGSYQEVVDFCFDLLPNARLFRAHRYYEVNDTMEMLVHRGIEAESNLCTLLDVVPPFLHRSNTINFPIFWEDGAYLYHYKEFDYHILLWFTVYPATHQNFFDILKFITIQSHTKLLSVNASIHTEQQFHMTG